MKLILIIIFSLGIFTCHAQTLITDANNMPTANTNAALELRSVSNNKGVMFPQVNLIATNNTSPFSTHLAGMIVYNKANNGTGNTAVKPGIYCNNGTAWQRLDANLPAFGDIKYGPQTTDHQGWYLLNGRATTTLSTTARVQANSLGFTSTLPDAQDKYLKTRNTETIGTTGGSQNIYLTQANLPNVTFNGTTNTTGSHTHTYSDRSYGVASSKESTPSTTAIDENVNATLTTSDAGAHTHTFTVTTGGSGTPIVFYPSYIAMNIFVYLGN